MPNIGVSALFVRPGRVGGAEFMLYNLLAGLEAARDLDDQLIVFAPANLATDAFSFVSRVEVYTGRAKNRFVQESLQLPQFVRELDAIILPNYFTPPLRCARRQITVIHDLQYQHYPENFSRVKRMWLRATHEWSLFRSDYVVTISEFVRQDLLHRYGKRHSSKVHVIPNPIDWQRFESSPSEGFEASLPEGLFVLAVAAQYAHKNLETLIRAFAQVRQAKPELKLVLAGQLSSNLIGIRRGAALAQTIQELGLERSVVVTGHISDGDLGVLYKRACLFVFPSVFEGFGMPPVEALGMGLPVVTTQRTSLPEVTRGLAHYVEDPYDATELADKILALTEDPDRWRLPRRDVEELRAYYAPARIGRAYMELCR